MSIFNFFRKPVRFFSDEEEKAILASIQKAEKQTSGEVRLYIESKCTYINPLHRAKELFHSLKMDATKEHNGVLVYIAMKDKQLAVYGDEGIHNKVGQAYWDDEIKKIIQAFKQKQFAEGICGIIEDIGDALSIHFPYQSDTDKNELPDDIVFGK